LKHGGTEVMEERDKINSAVSTPDLKITAQNPRFLLSSVLEASHED
jgi:hypothetical protein